MKVVRLATVLAGLALAWQALVDLSGVPPYILPSPVAVAASLADNAALIGRHAAVTATEILAGLALGSALGCASALLLAWSPGARRWVLPLLVSSQAIPVFAIAPLLVLWLGYGLFSQVAMATLIIYFPVPASFYDGLRHIPRGWLELARTMLPREAPWAVLRHIGVPAALPALASGLRVAAAVAPIGAVVGEWVGSSAGLGYLMLHANGRMQIDLMFAALLALALLAVSLYFSVDAILRRLLPWQAEISATAHPHE